MGALQNLALPQINNAAAMLLSSGVKPTEAPTMNAAQVNFMRLQFDMMNRQTEDRLKAVEYARQLLSGVTDESSLATAKRQFVAEYPDYGQVINQIMPTYSEEGKMLLNNSLMDEGQKIQAEQAQLQREKQQWEQQYGIQTAPAGSSVYQAGKKVEQVPTKKTPETVINLIGERQTEAEKTYGRGIGERINTRLDQAIEAGNQNMQLDMVSEALDKGAQTGFGEETILNIKSAAQTLGFDTGDLSGQELIRKVSNEMALRLRNPESGLGLTGNTSNKDLDFLKNSVIGLARTEQGNRLIIKYMKKMNDIKVDVARHQQQLIRQNEGAIPEDLDTQIMDYVNGLSVLSDNDRSQINKLSGNPVKTYKYKDKLVYEYADGTRAYAQ